MAVTVVVAVAVVVVVVRMLAVAVTGGGAIGPWLCGSSSVIVSFLRGPISHEVDVCRSR